MSLKEINEEVINCPETVFDTFDLTVDLKCAGNALRQQLVRLSNNYGRINQLTSNALLLHEKSKSRKDEVESLAWGQTDASMKLNDKRKFIKTVEVDFYGINTTLADEEKRVNEFAYIYNRGKDLVKEISSVLDVGRTLLSWDKNEQGKAIYD